MSKFDGIAFKIGGEEWIVPPLNFQELRKNRELLDSLIKAGTDQSLSPQQFETIVKLITLALSRNYPDITVEKVEEMVDLGNMGPLVLAAMGVSKRAG